MESKENLIWSVPRVGLIIMCVRSGPLGQSVPGQPLTSLWLMGWQLGQSQRAAGPTGGPNRAELKTSYFHFLTRYSRNMRDTLLMYWCQSGTVLSNWAESLVNEAEYGKSKSDANHLFSKPYQHCMIFLNSSEIINVQKWTLHSSKHEGTQSCHILPQCWTLKLCNAKIIQHKHQMLNCIYTFMYIHYLIIGWIIDLFSLNKLKQQLNNFFHWFTWLKPVVWKCKHSVTSNSIHFKST